MARTRSGCENCRALTALDAIGVRRTFGRDAVIYDEGQPAEYLYKVLSGTVRKYRILSDGRRQIDAFHFPGEYIGLEIGEEHEFSADAIEAVEVLRIKRGAVAALAQHDIAFAQQLWKVTACDLRRTQAHMLLLIRSARERVAAFLMDMDRYAPTGSAVRLPMSRQDIADYLGLTIETVSRTLTHLESSAAIELPTSRRVVLRNRDALSELNA